MKRKCLNCVHGFTSIDGWGGSRFDSQSCDFGLKEGAAPVGEYCPMAGKKLQNASEETIKRRFKES